MKLSTCVNDIPNTPHAYANYLPIPIHKQILAPVHSPYDNLKPCGVTSVQIYRRITQLRCFDRQFEGNDHLDRKHTII